MILVRIRKHGFSMLWRRLLAPHRTTKNTTPRSRSWPFFIHCRWKRDHHFLHRWAGAVPLALAPEKADRLVKPSPLRLVFISANKTSNIQIWSYYSPVPHWNSLSDHHVSSHESGQHLLLPPSAHLTCFGTTGGTAVAGTAGAATAAAEGSGSSCDQSISQCSVFQSCNQSIAKNDVSLPRTYPNLCGGEFCAIIIGLLFVFDPAQMYRVFAGANLAPKKCNPSNSLFTPCHHDPCHVFFPKSKWLVTLKLRPPKCRKKAGMKQEQSSPSEGITLPSNRAQEQR